MLHVTIGLSTKTQYTCKPEPIILLNLPIMPAFQNFSKMLPIILQKYLIILKIPDVLSLLILKILASVYS